MHTIENDSKVNTAKEIVVQIANRFKVPVEDVTKGRRYDNLPYLRKLMIYFIRNNNRLEYHFVAPLVGMISANSAAMYYRWVKNEYRTNEQLRCDIQAINSVFK